MKKSLQYVLIMSALGLQSGVLHAQEMEAEVDPQLVGAAPLGIPSGEQFNGITTDQLKTIYDNARSFPDLLQDRNLLGYDKLISSNGSFSWDNIKGLSLPQKSAVINLLVSSQVGQKFVHFAIPKKEKENLLIEMVRSGRLEGVRNFSLVQGFTFMCADTGVNLYRGFGGDMTPQTISNFHGMLKAPYSNVQNSDGAFIPAPLLALTIVMATQNTPGSEKIFGNIIENAVAKNGKMDITEFVTGSRFPDFDKVYIFGRMGASPSAINSISMLPDSAKGKILDLVIKFKTNNVIVMADFDISIFRVTRKWNTPQEYVERIRRNLILYALDPQVQVGTKLRLLGAMKENIKDSKEQLAFDELQGKVLNSIPSKKKRQVAEELLKQGKSEEVDFTAVIEYEPDGRLNPDGRFNKDDLKNEKVIRKIEVKEGTVEGQRKTGYSKEGHAADDKVTKSIDKKAVDVDVTTTKAIEKKK